MPLSSEQKRRFRKIGHHLKPVVIVAEQGLSTNVLAEIERALEDHELIKVKCNVLEREDKTALLAAICETTGAELAQAIGKIGLYYRPAKNQNAKLSNLARFQHLNQ
jgi:RNA-binding protein